MRRILRSTNGDPKISVPLTKNCTCFRYIANCVSEVKSLKEPLSYQSRTSTLMKITTL